MGAERPSGEVVLYVLCEWPANVRSHRLLETGVIRKSWNRLLACVRPLKGPPRALMLRRAMAGFENIVRQHDLGAAAIRPQAIALGRCR